MGLSKNLFYIAAILAVFLCLFVDDSESRRTILKGRRTLTRTYFYDSILPAWIVVLLIALGEIILGGILYIILKRVMIDPPIAGFYSVQRGDAASLRS
ncbi:uncharacterized protein LOC123672547 [Harmonia axyridis]|uniref:uncharacterized protein LOC123672547 n=1 Tax=Harmonia axyridis TaxID=115357 RepID=UPI001E277866|nr:uncharacterized protein LOC123672547 [Harmonia axyridis]